MHRIDVKQNSQDKVQTMSRLYEIPKCDNSGTGILFTYILIQTQI